MKEIWHVIWPYLRNKYVVTILSFTIWFLFFSQYNLMDRFRIADDIEQLKLDKEYFREEIIRDSIQLHELTTDRENLEKYAREQYYMKQENEDIFVVIGKERK